MEKSISIVYKANFCFALICALGWASPATAGYTVIDDDLLPTSMAGDRYISRFQEQYAVSFPRDRSALTDSSRAVLDALIARMQGSSIRIVGRPDAHIVSPEKASLLSSNRANGIRDYLLKKGIPASNVFVEVSHSPNPQPNGVNYPSDVYITPLGMSERGALQTRRTQPNEEILSSGQAQRSDLQERQLPSSNESEQLMQFIDRALRDGQIQPAFALKLMRTLISNTSTQPTPSYNANNEFAAVKTTFVGTTAQRQPTPAIVPSNTWVLDRSRTLKQNLMAWAQRERLGIEWDLPPSFIEPTWRETTTIRAASLSEAITFVLQGLHTSGYTPIQADIYSDVVRFSKAQ